MSEHLCSDRADTRPALFRDRVTRVRYEPEDAVPTRQRSGNRVERISVEVNQTLAATYLRLTVVSTVKLLVFISPKFRIPRARVSKSGPDTRCVNKTSGVRLNLVKFESVQTVMDGG